MKMIKEFHQFLKNERAVRIFQRALLNNEIYNKGDSIVNSYKHWQEIAIKYEFNPRRYIKSSFIWDDKKYWKTMHLRWLKYLRRLENATH